MDKLNEKYKVTKNNLIELINNISNKYYLKIELKNEDNTLILLTKLNKILLKLKMDKMKMKIGFNILAEEIFNLILIDKTEISNEEIEKLFIYFYFYVTINELEEIPKMFFDKRVKWQIIKQIQNDLKLLKSYSYINGEIYLNK
jgi:hypothetical protein